MCVCVLSVRVLGDCHTHTQTANALCFVITCLVHMQRRRAGERLQKQRQRSLVSVSSHLLLFVVVFQLRSRTNLWKEMRIAFVSFLVSHLFSALQFRKLRLKYFVICYINVFQKCDTIHLSYFFTCSASSFFFSLCRFFNILKLHLVPLRRGFFPLHTIYVAIFCGLSLLFFRVFLVSRFPLLPLLALSLHFNGCSQFEPRRVRLLFI